MTCNCNDTTSNTCTCVTNYNAKCVIYRGTTTCDDLVETGDTVEDAIKALATAICSGITTPSGNVTIVDNVDGETTVSSSTVGSTTTYTVGLDDAITDQIEENTADIAVLQDCCDNSIWTLVTDTPDSLDISETGAHEWTINYVSPSGVCACSGMTLNDTTGYAPDGTGGTQVVFTNTQNFTTDNTLAVGDRIIYTFIGQQAHGSSGADTVQIQLLNGATVKFNIENAFVSDNFKFSFQVVVVVTPTNVATGAFKLDATWLYNSTPNGTEDTTATGYIKSVFQKSITAMDFSAFKVQVNYINSSLEGATYNKLNLVSTEVTKGI